MPIDVGAQVVGPVDLVFFPCCVWVSNTDHQPLLYKSATQSGSHRLAYLGGLIDKEAGTEPPVITMGIKQRVLAR
ncbi:MAG: hypothetical protein H6526_06585 [Actinobacteria bacterium]|nr:hypothetical protein [Actinomycetota bacterium]